MRSGNIVPTIAEAIALVVASFSPNGAGRQTLSLKFVIKLSSLLIREHSAITTESSQGIVEFMSLFIR